MLTEQLVLAALPLADSVALRYHGRGIETEDLVQVARTALVKAVRRYRPGVGAGFAAYASPTISGEVKRWFRDQGWAVRPPRRIQELRAGLVVEEERLRHALRREPLDEEMAHVLAVTAAEVAEARACSAGYHATSLDALTGAGTSLADHVLVEPGPRGHLRGARRPAPFGRVPERAAARRAPPALRRGADPGRDRRADRRQPDAGLPHPARHPRPAACRPASTTTWRPTGLAA